jgi:hypothetical protein
MTNAFDYLLLKYSQDGALKPDKLERAREMNRLRGQRFRQKLMNEYTGERKDLKSLKFLSEEDKTKLEESYQNIEHKHLKSEKEKAKKEREKIQKGELAGSSNTIVNFSGFKDEWRKATIQNDQKAKVIIIQNLRAALNQYADNQPEVQIFSQTLEKFRDWRDQLRTINNSKILSSNISQEFKPLIENIIFAGKNLLHEFNNN